MSKIFLTSNRYLATSLVSLSVWIISILINALLFVLIFAFGSNGGFWEGIGLILICSALFSLPGIFIFWIVFVIRCSKRNLFSVLLITASCTSFLSVLIFFVYLAMSFGADRGISIFIIPVLAAIGSVALHRTAITDVNFAHNEIYHLKECKSLET